MQLVATITRDASIPRLDRDMGDTCCKSRSTGTNLEMAACLFWRAGSAVFLDQSFERLVCLSSVSTGGPFFVNPVCYFRGVLEIMGDLVGRHAFRIGVGGVEITLSVRIVTGDGLHIVRQEPAGQLLAGAMSRSEGALGKGRC